MKKMAAMVLSGVLALGLITGCSKSETKADSNEKVLVMGTSADYKPFEFIDTANSDEIIGFDVDLANHIAKELGYTLKIKDMDFNTLITAIKTDKVDIVLAGMTPTEERKKSVDFSDVYYTAKNVILTESDSGISSLEDLNGKTIGAQTGSIQETAVKELQESGVDVELKSLNRIPDLVQEMKSGRIDGIVAEDMITSNYLERDKNLEIVDILPSGEKGSAVALKKGSDLTEKINKVIAEMKENGEMGKIADKWFN